MFGPYELGELQSSGYVRFKSWSISFRGLILLPAEASRAAEHLDVRPSEACSPISNGGPVALYVRASRNFRLLKPYLEWVVISGVISPLLWVIIMVTLLITPLITTHEPPSSLDRA